MTKVAKPLTLHEPLITIRLQREAFDAAAESAKLTRGRTDVGAVVSFTGICRGNEDGEPIAALTLEHYPEMAEAEIERHVAEACDRWPLSRRHRHSPLWSHRARRSHRAGDYDLLAPAAGFRGG